MTTTTPKTYPEVPPHVSSDVHEYKNEVIEEPVTATLVSVGTSNYESDSKLCENDSYLSLIFEKINIYGYNILKKITHENITTNTIIGSLIGGSLAAIPSLILKDKHMIEDMIKGSLCGAVYFTSLRYIVYGKNKDIKTCCIFLNGVALYFVTKCISPANIKLKKYMHYSIEYYMHDIIESVCMKLMNKDLFDKHIEKVVFKNVGIDYDNLHNIGSMYCKKRSCH